jgi:hypothetical protein
MIWSELAGKMKNAGPIHWLFFDTPERRAEFHAWMEAPEDPNKPRVGPMRHH